LLGEDQAGREDQAVEEGQPGGALQKGGHRRVDVQASLTGTPVLQGGTRHVITSARKMITN
jgi:hypothetical protein